MPPSQDMGQKLTDKPEDSGERILRMPPSVPNVSCVMYRRTISTREVTVDQRSSKTVIALCGVQGCCPTAEISDTGVVLRDDYNGSMRLTQDEWRAFISKAKNGDFD
jgi:hypothetical protein